MYLSTWSYASFARPYFYRAGQRWCFTGRSSLYFWHGMARPHPWQKSWNINLETLGGPPDSLPCSLLSPRHLLRRLRPVQLSGFSANHHTITLSIPRNSVIWPKEGIAEVEEKPFFGGLSKWGGAAQIDFDIYLKTEKVVRLEWRKPPNFTFTAAGYAGYACSCSSVSKLGPRARSCFRADLYLEVGSLRPLSDRVPVWQAGCWTELTTRRRENLSTYLDQYSLSKNMVVVNMLQDFEVKIHSLYDWVIF